MKLLLTSGGVSVLSIREELVRLLGKPVEESTALCIPTAMYAHPWVGMGEKPWRFVAGQEQNPMVDLGWASMGLLELTALPTLDRDRWVPRVLEADALVVAGGDVLYLAHWMRESGLLDLVPQLEDTVWVGLSAGSMVMAPEVGEDFIQWRPPSGSTDGLGLVDFAIFPHLAPDGEPGNSIAEAEEGFGVWARVRSGVRPRRPGRGRGRRRRDPRRLRGHLALLGALSRPVAAENRWLAVRASS